MLQQEIFPREVTSGVPRITMTGSELVHVEQHRGLIACREDEIVIATACGGLTITGQALYFRRYTSVEAVIAGQIAGVSYAGKGRSG